jgi:hypothetical protein
LRRQNDRAIDEQRTVKDKYMPESVIIVQRSGGKYVVGAKVALGFSFSDHPFSSGVSEYSYTDENGEAVIHHSNRGRATVFVNGCDAGTINAPARKVVFL